MDTRSRLRSWLLVAFGAACGVLLAFLWHIVLASEPTRPTWAPRDIVTQSLIDNLESNNEYVRLYAVWRLGEMKGDSKAALRALEKMDLRGDEGLGKERVNAVFKLGGRL